MDVPVPRHLTQATFVRLVSSYYERSMDRNVADCCFDWTTTETATLPEVVLMLSWSGRLAQRIADVSWALPDPRIPSSDLDDLRHAAQVVLDRDRFEELQARLENIRRKALIKRSLFPGTRRSLINRLRQDSRQGCENWAVVDQWITAEVAPLDYMDTLGYLQRYEVFDRAREAGIALSPDSRELPKSRLARESSTPSLPLRPLRSIPEVSDAVATLSSPSQLKAVLGNYADLDVVESGALANILVTEIGRNVAEHSEGTNGWLCTRLVEAGEHLTSLSTADPVLGSFAGIGQGFLEVVVCDNGVGLTHGLERIVQRDSRESVQKKYSLDRTPQCRVADLIDYAFDRLSSTKRDIAELIQLERAASENGLVVAAGLHWVWNVVRNHAGVLAVRTGGTYAWYDFTRFTSDATNDWELVRPKTTHAHTTFCGTMIRVCLPLRGVPTTNVAVPHATQSEENGAAESEENRSRIASDEFQVYPVWIGDIARKAHPTYTRGKPRSRQPHLQQTLSGIVADPETEHARALLEELRREHTPLRDGDVLVLDLSGMRPNWAKNAVEPLCHFFLSMNYASTSGRSTVVLWNVPQWHQEEFELGMRIASRPFRHLSEFDRAAMMVTEDGDVRLFCGWPVGEQILAKLKWEGELDLDTRDFRDLDTSVRGRLRTIVSKNPHLLELVGHDRIRLRPWPTRLRTEVWRSGTKWLQDLMDRPVAKEHTPTLQQGLRLHLDDGYYRLPSTGKLVRDFYLFAHLVANHEGCSRLCWLLAQVIDVVQRRESVQVQWIVAVTRTATRIIHHLQENTSLVS